MPRFKIGDGVQWVRATVRPEFKNASGIISAVLDAAPGSDDFTMYDVKFSFGMFTLYDTQLEAEERGTSS